MTTPAYAVDPNKHLLLDPRVVARTEDCRLTLGRVKKDPANPLFTQDRPWEARIDNMYANVLRDPADGLYKCWYNPFLYWSKPGDRESSRETGLCYAVSEDGVTWEKPELGLIDFEGSTANNLVMRECHGAGVLIDENEADPARRFKMLFKTQEHRTKAQWEEGIMWLKTAASPDGLRWSLLPYDMPKYTYKQADTHNNVVWDVDRSMWVGITRTWDHQLTEDRRARRLVARMDSRDFLKWTHPVEVFREEPEEVGRLQTYAMPTFRYAGVYLGLVMMYHTGDPADPKRDYVECELAVSPNLIHWSRVCPGESLIPLGAKGAFDEKVIYAAFSPVVLDDEIRLYYGGCDGPHGGERKGAFGLARLRPDGFAGMAPERSGGAGAVVTAPVTCTGRTLKVTADAANGDLRVGVVGAGGRSVRDCDILSDNVTDAPVRWHGGKDLARFVGKDITLRFELGNATLYSFTFSD